MLNEAVTSGKGIIGGPGGHVYICRCTKIIVVKSHVNFHVIFFLHRHCKLNARAAEAARCPAWFR
jgi:hypothetical protein